jgi:hypothetical protein
MIWGTRFADTCTKGAGHWTMCINASFSRFFFAVEGLFTDNGSFRKSEVLPRLVKPLTDCRGRDGVDGRMARVRRRVHRLCRAAMGLGACRGNSLGSYSAATGRECGAVRLEGEEDSIDPCTLTSGRPA